MPNEGVMLNLKQAGSGINQKNQWGVNTVLQENMGDTFTAPLGDGQAFSILNRYKVVGYMWIRTA